MGTEGPKDEYQVEIYDNVDRGPAGPRVEVVATCRDFDAAVEKALEVGVKLMNNFPHGSFEIYGIYGTYKPGSTLGMVFPKTDLLRELIELDTSLQFIDPEDSSTVLMSVDVVPIY